MNKAILLLIAGLGLAPVATHGAQTAQARLYCRSLRVQRGTAVDMVGFRWSMDMTTLPVGVNGELAPDFFDSGYTNSTYVDLYSELFEETFPGAMAVDIPSTGDANGNGFLDFFEVSQAVAPIASPGAYNISGFGSGTFTASWSRDAGSAVGYCSYTIPNPFGGTLAFSHSFELIAYDGQLAYAPAATNVAGVFTLTETNSGNTLQGPATFVKSATNRFNQLTLQSAFLTNASLQTLSLYTSTSIFRRTAYPTNYFGPVEFNDGDPSTTDDDYYSWWLSLDDPNDSDHDGIPNFSDDARRPALKLTRGTTNLWLAISGDVGFVHRLQEATNVLSTNWQTVTSLSLTNDPQNVSLPVPSVKVKFWRVLAE